jgi:hypothetical protein
MDDHRLLSVEDIELARELAVATVDELTLVGLEPSSASVIQQLPSWERRWATHFMFPIGALLVMVGFALDATTGNWESSDTTPGMFPGLLGFIMLLVGVHWGFPNFYRKLFSPVLSVFDRFDRERTRV